jgi:elongation factor Ts
MAAITADAVKKLRERTDLPMMECKKALTQAGGDEEKAIEILRERSKGKLAERAANVTAEGRIFQRVADDLSSAVMVEIQCESEPVAGSEDMLAFGQMCLDAIDRSGTSDIAELMKQPTPDGSGKTISDAFEDMSGRIREKIVVTHAVKVKGPVAGYVHHNHKTGSLFQAEGDNPDEGVMRDVAMHIAAMRPQVATVEDLPAEQVQAERARLADEAKATGKPDNIVEKIVDGRLKTWYGTDAGVLTAQPFAKDDSKTVSQALAEKGLKAKAFHLWSIGN